MILTVGNVKGGVGKTTLAVNIAISRALAGRDVLLVDGDEQATARTFTELRTETLGALGYTAVARARGATHECRGDRPLGRRTGRSGPEGRRRANRPGRRAL